MFLPTLRVKRSFKLDMPVATAWQEMVSDSNRLRRALGQPASRLARLGAKLVQGETKMPGMTMLWKEQPHDWIVNQLFLGRVVYETSPLKYLEIGWRLEAQGQGSRLDLSMELIPRNVAGLLLGTLILQGQARNCASLCQKINENFALKAAYPLPDNQKFKINQLYLQKMQARLEQEDIAPALVNKLVEHLKTAPEDAVVRMRPYELAARWGVERSEIVRLFLQATRCGLLDLAWEIICPNCRVASGSFARLTELSRSSHCLTCNIEYDANFDQYVELRFSVNPQLRTASTLTHCIAGPFMTPHVLAQVWLPPGEIKEIRLPLEAGSYRLRTLPATEQLTLLAEPAAPGRAEVIFKPGATYPQEIRVADKPATLTFGNEYKTDLVVWLEQPAWGNQGLSAAEVTTLQEFRDLFSSEVLSPGLSVEVKYLTFLFTDLKDSTALYDQVGDTPAYSQVRDHFSILGEAIVKNKGALVKTIGDAVMAVFVDPAKAVTACLQIQSGIAQLNAARPDRAPLIVKLGLHAGPCLVITANDILDYFGSTVNIAARVQGVSQGGDLVLTEELMSRPEVAQLLKELPTEHFEINLKGLAQHFTLYRVWPK